MARKTAQQAGETRAAILASARASFTADGFAGASTARMAADAGVTEGALFHHFRTKRDLFLAVFTELEAELDAAARAASRRGTPLQRFVEGCRAYLNFVARDDYARIALIEAPSVLGHQTWHEVDSGLGLKTVLRGVENLIETGAISQQPARPLAVVFYGALNEAAFAVARREPGVSVDAMINVLERVLKGL